MKILVQPYTHTLSHISRPLLIAKELRNRGHEVIIAGESPKIKFIQDEGFEVFPLYEPDPELLFGNIRKGKLRFITDDEIEKMINADLGAFKKIKPDIVITDGRFTAPISAHIAGLPHVAIVNVSSTEYRALPYFPLFDWIPDWFIPRNRSIWRHLDILNLKLEMLVFDNVMNIFKKLSKKHGLMTQITATNCLAGKDITLLADIPEYFPTKNLPDNYYYIGPLTWKSKMTPPSWWPEIRATENPLVYLTMGTTGMRVFFQKVYELLKSSGITAIATTGAQIESMANIDGKIYVEPFIDGDLVMEKCDLVVCHGGNGTIYQALQHGKPVIGIPTIPDQQFNMRRVEALGIGKTIHPQTFEREPSSLLKIIKAITKDRSFYANANKLKQLIGRYRPASTAADIIENLWV